MTIDVAFFKKMHEEFKYLDSDYQLNNFYYYNEHNNYFLDLRAELLLKIDGTYKTKLKLINSLEDKTYSKVKTILGDMYFKYNLNKEKSKKNMEIEKLLKAREENIDFEIELAEMITGDNKYFPYRSSQSLTSFFQDLGYPFVHSGETRKTWVKEKLEELNIIEIYDLLSYGLFKRKHFISYISKLNNDIYEEENEQIINEMLVDIDEYVKEAKNMFELFIKNSIVANKPFDLSSVLDMNVNMELLFDNKANTKDIELNKLIEEAKERFISNDKQVGIEKLWDAFERLKTFFQNEEKNKKNSANRVVRMISNEFDKDFIHNEFTNLSKIGNNYRIRHHEIGKQELSLYHINYFFFRMLSLIDLCLNYLNKTKKERK